MSDNYGFPGPSSTKNNGRSQRRSPNKKKGRSAAFWVGVALAIIALLTLITCAAYFGYYLNKPYDEDPVEDDPEEPVPPTTQAPLVTTSRPNSHNESSYYHKTSTNKNLLRAPDVQLAQRRAHPDRHIGPISRQCIQRTCDAQSNVYHLRSNQPRQST